MARFCPNILLAKTDVGRVKPTNRILPPDDWCYGRDFGRDPEGAGQGTPHFYIFFNMIYKVTLSWKFHRESQGKKHMTDFTKLNKMCAQNSIINAKVVF